MRTLLRRALFAVGLVALYGATAATYVHSPSAATLLPAAALVCGLGVFVLGQRPSARLNRVFAFFCLCVTAWLVAVHLAYMAAAGWGYERVLWPIAFLRIGAIFAAPALLWFTYELSDRRGRFGRLLVLTAFLTMTPFVFLDPFLANRRLMDDKYVPNSTSYKVQAVFTIFWLLVWVALALREALGRTPTRKRSQCRICLAALLPGVLGGMLAFLPAFGGQWFPSSLGILVAFLPAAMGFGVLRYQMFDIKLAIRRTLPYAMMTGLIGVTYALVVAVIQHYGSLAGELPRGTELVALAILVGLGFQPTLEALQRGLDTAFFRSEAELDRYLAGASGRYGAAASVGEVAAMAADDVREEMELEWAATLLGSKATDTHSCGRVPPALEGSARTALTSLPEGSRPIDLVGDHTSQDGGPAGALREALAESGCRLAVPLDVPGGRGLLLCGEKRSHTPFGARDVTFVVALAAQAEGAIARVESRAEARQLRELTGAVL
ncbi:MAG: hypothetical protein ACYS9X_23130, partial [Planctomycetota bacterium]